MKIGENDINFENRRKLPSRALISIISIISYDQIEVIHWRFTSITSNDNGNLNENH
jgi:hypothetical protein